MLVLNLKWFPKGALNELKKLSVAFRTVLSVSIVQNRYLGQEFKLISEQIGFHFKVLSLHALTLQNSSSSSRKGVKKSEGMIGSAVLAESRSWTSEPAVENKKFLGPERRERDGLVFGEQRIEGVFRGRNAAPGVERDVFRGGKGREMKKHSGSWEREQRDPGRKVP